MSYAPGTNPGAHWLAHGDPRELPVNEPFDPRNASFGRTRTPAPTSSSFSRRTPLAEADEAQWSPARDPRFSMGLGVARPMTAPLGFTRPMPTNPLSQAHRSGRSPMSPLTTAPNSRPPQVHLPPVISPPVPTKIYRCHRSGCDGLGFPHQEAFEQHLRAHRRADKPYPCPFPGCPHGFDFLLEVNEHIKS